MLRAAAQPLLLLAERNHFIAKLLIRRPAYKSAIHVLSFNVGLYLMSGTKEKHRIVFVNERNYDNLSRIQLVHL